MASRVGQARSDPLGNDYPDRVVVRGRAGETTVLAVAYDVAVTTPRSEQELTFVVRVVE